MVAQGGPFAGWSLYLREGKPKHCHDLAGLMQPLHRNSELARARDRRRQPRPPHHSGCAWPPPISSEYGARPWQTPVVSPDAVRRAERCMTAAGGSYLCHSSDCRRYRVSARFGSKPDSSNVGLRVAADA
jgi:hypothetical protein